MNLLIIVTACVLAVKAEVDQRDCDGVYVKGKYYDKHIVRINLDRPFFLTVDSETDTLYFSYGNDETEEYKTACLNLTTNEIRDIEGIPNGLSYAVDSDNHLLYVGTKDGIYVYNFDLDKTEFFGAKGHYVWTLFFKDDVLYYSDYPSQNFYTYSNGESTRLKDLEHTKVHFFALDYDNDMFFSNDTGLFKQKMGSTDAVLYKTIDEWDIRSLTLDAYGNLYAGIHDGIYSVKRHEVKLDKVFPVHDLFGLVFDGENNIIYSDSTTVVKLVRNTNC